MMALYWIVDVKSCSTETNPYDILGNKFWPSGPIIWTTLHNLQWIVHVWCCSTETNPYDILGPVLTLWTNNLDHLAHLAMDCAC